jgi:GT2 family glycosyltransferase/glycosyltransferase involved in cell wall biosynthesis
VRVSFIIPVFNQLSHTRECLTSLKSSLPAGLEHEIILIDDGSDSETRDYLRSLSPACVVLLNERNLGYAASNNRAARSAQGEFLCLLNNDLVLAPGWLEPMLAAFDRTARAGVVGNIQLDAETGEVDHTGIVFSLGGYPVHEREPLAAIRACGDMVECAGVTAACCLVRRGWFERAGGFDEGYRNGFEDIDLCLRAREDGFVNLVATHSVVRHHISRSAGRGAYEFRNARRFLDRWGPRSAALEKEGEQQQSRRRAIAAAREFFAPLSRRLGFGPTTLRRHHRTVLRNERRRRLAAGRPVCVGVDLLRLGPGGGHGGVKTLVYSFLAEMGRQRGGGFTFVLFAQPTLRDELGPLLRDGDYVLEPAGDRFAVKQRLSAAWRDAGEISAADDVSAKAGLNVLYAPLGVSEFSRAGLPFISLIVDLLHRDRPETLPAEEVAFRHRWHARVTAEATYVQGISHHAIGRLQQHYGVSPARCFHTYIPVQNRLPAPPPGSPLPAGAPDEPFFFYPANFWPHKNHETLLVAYRLYVQGAASRAWPLVFTGHPDSRMELLRELRDGLGLTDRVRFLGHLNEAAFAALFARAGALVFPSLYEGFGIPLLEAMRFGLPILAAKSAALPEVGGDAGLFVDPRDPRAIADSLRRLAIREDLRAELADRGRARLNAFSLELEAGRLAHFLEAAARRQPA